MAVITNALEFSGQVLKETQELPKREVLKLQRRVVETYLRVVLPITPFLTGHLQANFTVSKSVADEEERFDEPVNHSEIIRRAKSALVGLRAFEPIFITNNARYASFVNDGTAQNAAAMFNERAIDATDAILARVE